MDGVKPRLPNARAHASASLARSGLASASFSSSPLLRLLTGLGVAEVAPSTLSLAERWSPWLAWTDAITLSAVLSAGATATAVTPGQAAGLAGLTEELKRVRQDLAQAIGTDAALTAGAAGQPGSAPAQDAAALADSGLAGLQRQYQAHQRAMEQRIGPLRARVRAVLAGQCGELARLAALDGVLDEALAARQRRLLATVPGWLDTHSKRAPAALPEAAALQQRMLLAELDLRLQPVEAMIDALARSAGPPPNLPAGPLATARTLPRARGQA